MNRFFLLALCMLAFVGCKPPESQRTGSSDNTMSLTEARKGYTTRLVGQSKANRPVPKPPAKLFSKVQFESPAGKLAAYITPDPKDGKKRPAIIWITGGDCNTIGDVWTPERPSNDQTAAQYRNAGIVMMFPSLRGGNDNPGFKENFYGEVDDVLAAADYLAKQDHVDPNRIYLGGHSTGGTLVLLVAECSDRFRGVFSFGPVDDIRGYGGQFTEAVNTSDTKEVQLRSPGFWLHSIQSPTFVFEGTVDGNLRSLEAMAAKSQNPKARFFPVKGVNHFSILAPVNTLIAQKILKDDGTETNLAFTDAELAQAKGK
jgi:dipeptidyl aminopeptidase/acylaminoacyl peptidase